MGKPLKPAEVLEQFGHTPQQMRRYEEQGLIKASRTSGNHRRYDQDAVTEMFKAAEPTELKPKDRYLEFGTTGLRQWAGSVHEERLRSLQGRQGRIEKREMRLNDPIISAIFFGILNAIKQTTIRIAPVSEKPADREVAEFVESAFFDMVWTWQDQLTFTVEPTLEQGFSLLETVYKRRLGANPPKYVPDPAKSMFNDGRIGWRKLPPRPAETLAQGREWDFDENGGINGIWQMPETDFDRQAVTIFIPIQKLLHFRTTPHPANNPEGMEIHRAMYLPYWYSRNIQEIEAISIERNLAGLPVAYMGQDTRKSGANNDYDLLKEITSNIRIDEQMGVVFPYAKMGEGAKDGEGVLLELLSADNAGSGGINIGETLDRYDKQKAISVLAQFIMLGMNNVGSYALSRHQGDIFILAISAFLRGVADVYNRHAIPKLIMFNDFQGITGFPELVFSTLGVPNLGEVSEFINKLVDKAVITPDIELERHLRQLADLPELDESAVVVDPPEQTAPPEPENEPAENEDEDEETEKQAINKKSMKPLKLSDKDLDRLSVITDEDISIAHRFTTNALSREFKNLLLAEEQIEDA